MDFLAAALRFLAVLIADREKRFLAPLLSALQLRRCLRRCARGSHRRAAEAVAAAPFVRLRPLSAPFSPQNTTKTPPAKMLSLFLQEAAVSSAPYFFGYMGAAFALGAMSATTCSRQFRTDEERIETESAHTNGSICSAISSLACRFTAWRFLAAEGTVEIRPPLRRVVGALVATELLRCHRAIDVRLVPAELRRHFLDELGVLSRDIVPFGRVGLHLRSRVHFVVRKAELCEPVAAEGSRRTSTGAAGSRRRKRCAARGPGPRRCPSASHSSSDRRSDTVHCSHRRHQLPASFLSELRVSWLL